MLSKMIDNSLCKDYSIGIKLEGLLFLVPLLVFTLCPILSFVPVITLNKLITKVCILAIKN